ncbi:MAG: MFS transporter [Oscillospiraceae bacterium]|jgi:DHA3 family macrolide efflux protein-like MFS transporter|nr:MFS transporter [Oscillospiraceae bacterium]
MSMISPLNWKRNVALYMSGQGITLFGSSLVSFSVMWHITLETQSGLMMTFIIVAGFLPTFLISPFAGVWADRYNKKYLIILSDAFTAIITLVMAVLFTLGYEFIGLLLSCLAARAFARGVQMPAFNALIPELVPEEHLTRVNGINGSMQTIMTFAAPSISGILIAVAPIQTVLFIDVATTVIGISILLFFVKILASIKKSENKSGVKQYISEIGEGFGYIKGKAFLKLALVISALLNFMIATTAMTPLLVARKWGADTWNIFGTFFIEAEHRLAISEIGYSGGMVLGGLIIAAWGGFKNKNYTFALFTLMVGIAQATLGLVNNFWLFTLFMSLTGLFLSIRSAPIMAMLQSNIERDYMGRSMSTLMMVASLTVQLGMLLWGPLGDVISVDWLLLGSGLFIMFMGIQFFFNKTLLKAGLSTQVSDSPKIL